MSAPAGPSTLGALLGEPLFAVGDCVHVRGIGISDHFRVREIGPLTHRWRTGCKCLHTFGLDRVAATPFGHDQTTWRCSCPLRLAESPPSVQRPCAGRLTP